MVYYLPRPVSAADLTLMRRIASEEALAKHGKPEIFNTDQGSQFTGSAFTGVLANSGIAIMDGKAACKLNEITPNSGLSKFEWA